MISYLTSYLLEFSLAHLRTGCIDTDDRLIFNTRNKWNKLKNIFYQITPKYRHNAIYNHWYDIGIIMARFERQFQIESREYEC